MKKRKESPNSKIEANKSNKPKKEETEKKKKKKELLYSAADARVQNFKSNFNSFLNKMQPHRKKNKTSLVTNDIINFEDRMGKNDTVFALFDFSFSEPQKIADLTPVSGESAFKYYKTHGVAIRICILSLNAGKPSFAKGYKNEKHTKSIDITEPPADLSGTKKIPHAHDRLKGTAQDLQEYIDNALLGKLPPHVIVVIEGSIGSTVNKLKCNKKSYVVDKTKITGDPKQSMFCYIEDKEAIDVVSVERVTLTFNPQKGKKKGKQVKHDCLSIQYRTKDEKGKIATFEHLAVHVPNDAASDKGNVLKTFDTYQSSQKKKNVITLGMHGDTNLSVIKPILVPSIGGITKKVFNSKIEQTNFISHSSGDKNKTTTFMQSYTGTTVTGTACVRQPIQCNMVFSGTSGIADVFTSEKPNKPNRNNVTIDHPSFLSYTTHSGKFVKHQSTTIVDMGKY